MAPLPQHEVFDSFIRRVGERAAGLDPRRLVPGSMLTQKAAKAFALQAKGQDIEILTEDDLLRAM